MPQRSINASHFELRLYVTEELTPWRIVLLQSLNDTLLVKKNFLSFMEPKGPLLCSQELTTGPYPEPDACSSCLPPLFS